MNCFNMLDQMVEDKNGYLCTMQAVTSGISRPTLADYVKRRNMERVAHGVYLAEDAWRDDLYLLHLTNSRVVFSHETALLLHGLMEREPKHISVTVPAGYNATHLRKKSVRVYQVKPEIARLGATQVETAFGNTVCAYDRERTICDVLRCKDDMDIQVFRHAMREYMQGEQKNIPRLMAYAKVFRIESTARTYTEVLL